MAFPSALRPVDLDGIDVHAFAAAAKRLVNDHGARAMRYRAADDLDAVRVRVREAYLSIQREIDCHDGADDGFFAPMRAGLRREAREMNLTAHCLRRVVDVLRGYQPNLSVLRRELGIEVAS